MVKKKIKFELLEIFYKKIIQLKTPYLSNTSCSKDLVCTAFSSLNYVRDGGQIDAGSWQLQVSVQCFLFLYSLDPHKSVSDPISMQRTQIKDNLALPFSQCGPTALYRRPLAASALPPGLAALRPGKKNKRASVEEEIKSKKCECKESSGLVYGIPLSGTTNLQYCNSCVWNTFISIILKLTALILFLITWKNIIIERWHLPIAFFRTPPYPSLCFSQIMMFITLLQCSSPYLKKKPQILHLLNTCPLECQKTPRDLTHPYNHRENLKYKAML